MKLNFKHVCAFSTFLLAVTPAATTPFTHTQTLPVLSGYTASANWMTNGYNSDGTNCKVIVVGSHAPTYGSWKACYWVVTMNSSGYVGSTSETEMSGFADVSYATGVNEDGHVCGYGHIPGGGGIGMPAPAGGDSATAAGGDMPIGGGTNAPYAFVWKNMGTLSQPNYGTYNGYTNTWDYYPYLLSLQNGYAQYATAISKGVTTNTGYVCGSTSNSTPGWYQSLDYLFGHYNNTLSTNYDGPTVAPMDYCNCIDPVNHHIGGSGNLLKFNNARQNPPDYDTTATSVPQVSWWDGYVTWHPWVINALRGNSGGSSITLTGGIGVSMGRYLACFGTLSGGGAVLTGNKTYKGTNNTPRAMNSATSGNLIVGYSPFTPGVEYNGAWYTIDHANMTWVDCAAYYCVNESNSDGALHRPTNVPMACGLDVNGNAAIFW